MKTSINGYLYSPRNFDKCLLKFLYNWKTIKKMGECFMMRKKMVKKLSEMLHKEPKFKEQSSTQDIEIKRQTLSTDNDKNLSTFKTIYSFPDSIDVKIREFNIGSLNQRAFIVFLSTMADTKDIQEGIMEKLLQNQDPNRKIQDIVGNPFCKTVTII